MYLKDVLRDYNVQHKETCAILYISRLCNSKLVKLPAFQDNYLSNMLSATVKQVENSHSQKDRELGFQDQLSLNAGQKYCRMLPLEHSAILLIFIKLPFVIKIFVLSIFEQPFYTGFTAYLKEPVHTWSTADSSRETKD